MGQTFYTDISIDASRLSESEQSILLNIIPKIKHYIEFYDWRTNNKEIEMDIAINIVIQSITESGFEKIYHGQVVWTNKFDQRYVDSKWIFSLSEQNNFIHSGMPNSINNFLDYYIYLFLAAEMDTYEYRLGNSLYAKAEEVARQGMNSNYGSGWKKRIDQISTISSNLPFRQFRFDIYKFRDQLFDEEKNINHAETLQKLLDLRNEIIEDGWSDKYFQIFWNAHHRELGFDLAQFGDIHLLDRLAEEDSNNAKFYAELLDEIIKKFEK